MIEAQGSIWGVTTCDVGDENCSACSLGVLHSGAYAALIRAPVHRKMRKFIIFFAERKERFYFVTATSRNGASSRTRRLADGSGVVGKHRTKFHPSITSFFLTFRRSTVVNWVVGRAASSPPPPVAGGNA